MAKQNKQNKHVSKSMQDAKVDVKAALTPETPKVKQAPHKYKKFPLSKFYYEQLGAAEQRIFNKPSLEDMRWIKDVIHLFADRMHVQYSQAYHSVTTEWTPVALHRAIKNAYLRASEQCEADIAAIERDLRENAATHENAEHLLDEVISRMPRLKRYVRQRSISQLETQDFERLVRTNWGFAIALRSPHMKAPEPIGMREQSTPTTVNLRAFREHLAYVQWARESRLARKQAVINTLREQNQFNDGN